MLWIDLLEAYIKRFITILSPLSVEGMSNLSKIRAKWLKEGIISLVKILSVVTWNLFLIVLLLEKEDLISLLELL